MSDWYSNSRCVMGKFRCIKHRHTNELCLAGERGEIWETSPNRYKAFIVLPSGSEKIYSFESKDLAKQVLRLKVPLDTDRQIELATYPNKRVLST